MLRSLQNATYLATLKWKQGEIKSLRTFGGDKSDLAILFDIPPAGDYDHELGTVLEPTEYLKQFGSRLQKSWGRRGVFIDAAKVDDERHKAGLGVHPLTELLERARMAEALAFPVTGPDRSSEYQAAVLRFADANPSMPIGIRIRAAEALDDFGGLARDIRLLKFQLGVAPDRCLLVLDFGFFDPHDLDGFASLVVDRLNALPFLHEWLNIAISMTAFPQTPKLKAGTVGKFQRSEWEVYKRIAQASPLRMPIFGDYALENPALGPTGRISPVAQARYSDGRHHYIFKGATTKKPNGYEAIFPVVDALTSDAVFCGPSFSLGDAYFHNLAKLKKSTGNASTWRWAATDHHLTMVLASLRELFGMPAYKEAAPSKPTEQLELLPR